MKWKRRRVGSLLVFVIKLTSDCLGGFFSVGNL